MNEEHAHADDAGNDAGATTAPTLDAIFRVNARRSPDVLALCDPPDRDAFTDGTARRLTYAETDAAVSALAARIKALGLCEGAVVGLQIANTVESVVSILALMHAGLIPAPLPLLWREDEMARALSAAGARALIVGSRVGATDHGTLALHAAVGAFGIRFVCGFGATLPDGMVPLDDIWEPQPEPQPEPDFGACPTALITFDAAAGEPKPVAHTHTELMVGGLAVVLEGAMPQHGGIIGTMLPASFAVFTASVVPWLLTGGTLALHQPFDPQVLGAQIVEAPDATLVLPGPVLAEFAGGGALAADPQPARVLAVWRSPQAQAADRVFDGAPAATDVLALGEAAVLPLRRQDGCAGRPRLGAVRAPSGASEGTAVLTLIITAHGTLAVSGPMVPAALRGGSGDEIDTGLACHCDPESGTLVWGPAPTAPELPQIAEWEGLDPTASAA